MLHQLLLISSLLWVAHSQYNYDAYIVYGQNGLFTTNNANSPTRGAGTLNVPNSVVFGLNPLYDFYVLDSANHRVLYYANLSATQATRVYGQLGNFASGTPNLGGISSLTLNNPISAAVDTSGALYISDTGNNRVLYYPAGATTPSFVYGQGGDFNTRLVNNGGVSGLSLASPAGVSLDSLGNLYVSDGLNHRILKFVPGNATAVDLWGQASYTDSLANRGTTPGANTLSSPMAIIAHSTGLYVADLGNSRILFFGAYSKTATRVYGQGGSFTTASSGLSANGLSSAVGITCHPQSGALYVADTTNNRVLYYPGTSTTATVVYGQSGSFTTNTVLSPLSNKTIFSPFGVSVAGNYLAVVDSGNNRVLLFLTVEFQSTTPPPAGTAPCFHEGTIIQYKDARYTLADFQAGKVAECFVPHVVKTDGYALGVRCVHHFTNATTKSRESTVRLTGDHLVSTRNGKFVAAQDLAVGTPVIVAWTDYAYTQCSIASKTREFAQHYFGLNCLESIVYANGVQTSTFGSYHHLPAAWMSWVGRAFGIERASRWGDALAQWAHRSKLY